MKTMPQKTEEEAREKGNGLEGREDPSQSCLGKKPGLRVSPLALEEGSGPVLIVVQKRQMVWKARQCPRNIHNSKPI